MSYVTDSLSFDFFCPFELLLFVHVVTMTSIPHCQAQVTPLITRSVGGGVVPLRQDVSSVRVLHLEMALLCPCLSFIYGCL